MEQFCPECGASILGLSRPKRRIGSTLVWVLICSLLMVGLGMVWRAKQVEPRMREEIAQYETAQKAFLSQIDSLRRENRELRADKEGRKIAQKIGKGKTIHTNR